MVTILRRGAYALPHQAQTTRRDFDAERIVTKPGSTGAGYRLSAEQMEAARERVGAPYEYLITDDGALAWTAFHTKPGLDAWAQAYGIALDPEEPAPGSRFTIALPADLSSALPLVDSGIAYDPARNYGVDYDEWQPRHGWPEGSDLSAGSLFAADGLSEPAKSGAAER
jgi:hypothetical protein